MTTVMNYGELTYQRQGEIIRDMANPKKEIKTDADEIVEKLFQKLNKKDQDE